MTTPVTRLQIDSKNTTEALEQLRNNLAHNGEVTLDFSMVQQISAPALALLKDVAASAQKTSCTITLCGVNAAVYKVLKLVNLSPGFRFANGCADQSQTRMEQARS